MNENIIKKYVTLNNIKKIAIKENIILKENEDKIIFNYIINNWNEIYRSNNYDFTNLKKDLSSSTYDSIINLYNKYKKNLL